MHEPEALTVLIVEDEPLLRGEIAKCLTEAGYRVLEAANAEGALIVLSGAELIHLLFTDIGLGGIVDGWDVAEAFRERYPLLPIVYTSGYLTKPPRIVDGGLFVTKPYLPHQIVHACRKLTEAHRKRGAR